jgi:antitoxin VapB
MNARLPSSVLPDYPQKSSTIFTSGNSQAIRIPKDFQLSAKHVTIINKGHELVIRPKFKTLGELLDSLPPLSAEEAQEWDSVMETIQQSRKQMLPLRDVSHLFADDEPLEIPLNAKRANRTSSTKKTDLKKKRAP